MTMKYTTPAPIPASARHIDVGSRMRMRPPEAARADREVGLSQAVTRVAVEFIDAGHDRLSAVEIRAALKDREDLDVTTTRVGLLLGALGFERRRTNRRNSWAPSARFLEVNGLSAADAQEGRKTVP